MTAALNKYYAKEFIQLVKQVKITSLTYCQPSILGRVQGVKTCLLSTKAATYPPLPQRKTTCNCASHELVATNISNFTWATIPASSCNISSLCHHTQTCTLLIRYSSLFLAQVSLSLPSSLYCSIKGLVKNQSIGVKVLLSSMDFTLMKTDFLWKLFQKCILTVMGRRKKKPKSKQHKQTNPPHTSQGSQPCNHDTHPPHLCSPLAWYAWISHLNNIELLHRIFVGGNVLLEYVLQAQIQNQMQKEGGNFSNFAI